MKTRFWIQWTLLSAAIITTTYLVSLIVVGIINDAFGFDMQSWGTPLSNTVMQIAGGAVIGAGTGLYQKLMLQKQFRVTPAWIYTIILGFVLTELVAGIVLWQMDLIRSQLRFIEHDPLPESLIFAFAGFLTGLFQWFILRKVFTNSALWIIASTVGWWLSVFSAYLLGLIDQGISVWGFIPGALLYGAITGATFMWVLKPRIS